VPLRACRYHLGRRNRWPMRKSFHYERNWPAGRGRPGWADPAWFGKGFQHHANVCRRGFDAQLNSFVLRWRQAAQRQPLLVGLLAADDPRPAGS
jgi:hypothetical protein